MADLKSSERGTDLLGEALAEAFVHQIAILDALEEWGYRTEGEALLAAARNWHTLPPVWEQAHRLRDALLDSFNDHEIRTMAELFELVMDDGVTQAWVRALTEDAAHE